MRAEVTQPTILLAGIGNIFLGDDGFGVEVARHLAHQPLRPQVRVEGFGIRGFDLALALLQPYETVVLIDAISRGDAPGVLSLLELPSEGPIAVQPADGHSLDPASVLRIVNQWGGTRARLFLLGCQPCTFDGMSLSPVVEHAVHAAVEMIEELIGRLLGPAGAGVRADVELGRA